MKSDVNKVSFKMGEFFYWESASQVIAGYRVIY